MLIEVGICEGTMVGSFVRGEIVGDPSGTAGQNSGQALDISALIIWCISDHTMVVFFSPRLFQTMKKIKAEVRNALQKMADLQIVLLLHYAIEAETKHLSLCPFLS